MPLSEFLRLAIEKLEYSRNKPCSIDLSSPRAENDLVQDSGIANSTTRSVGNFGEVEDVNLGLNQNDEIIPWLSYSVDDDDGMQDYCSELLPEISDVTGDGILPGKSSKQAISNLDVDFKVSKGRTSCSWLTQQGQTSDPTASNIIRTNNDSNNHNNSSCNNQDSILLNFSNIARPAKGKMEVQEKGSSCRCNSKAAVVERLSISHKDIDFPVPSAPTLFKSGKLEVRESKESFLAERSENLLPKKNEKAIFRSSGVIDIDRIVEPVVACSSVGSGNSADRVSCEQTHHSKRKFIDIEEFECHSEDVETESVGVKKRTLARGGSGLKRSRAAEVHNLSERRRRDRINEKMRALQELIPNCNKADKASMLDEAIEYLKNLQLQVQMMSMGAGLCMPQMMFHPHLSAMHFSGSPQYPIFPMQRPHFPSSSSGPANFPRIPLRISSYNEMPSTPPKLNSEDLTGNKNLNFKNTAEGGNSMNRTSNQTSAVHEKKLESDVGRRGALTSTSATSNEAGCD